MKREAELARRLRALEALGEAVDAMKSLSAHHFREARSAVDASRGYRAGVARIAAWAGATVASGRGPVGLLVVGGELGLCGGYNARVVSAAQDRRAACGPGPTLCAGRRATTLLSRHGVEVTRRYGAPTGVRGVADLLLRLAEDVFTVYVNQDLASFDVVYSRFAGVGVTEPTTIRLLPLTAESTAPARPARYVEGGVLATAAARELMYVTLHDVLLDALASEHGARLVATESAREWLDDRTTRVRRLMSATRREASTQEVIEIVGGARARRRAIAPPPP